MEMFDEKILNDKKDEIADFILNEILTRVNSDCDIEHWFKVGAMDRIIKKIQSIAISSQPQSKH